MTRLLIGYISLFRINLHDRMIRYKLKRFVSKIGGRILDVGAGTKPYEGMFSRTEYIGTNTADHPNHPAGIEKHTDLWIDDAASLPVDSGSFDSVVCFQVLNVMKDAEGFFAESYRVLKPGGKFLLTVDFLYPPWSHADNTRYSAKALQKLAEAAGYKILSVEGFGGIKSLTYVLRSRWIMDYPRRLKATKGITKVFRILRYLCYLLWMPGLSLIACYAYYTERNITDNTGSTFNLLLFAEKPV